MFDIGFWELILICLLGLIVLGPKRLPKVARQVSDVIKSLKSIANGVKNELEQDIKYNELHENLKKFEALSKDPNQHIPDELKESLSSLQASAQALQTPYKKVTPPIDENTSDHDKLNQETLKKANNE